MIVATAARAGVVHLRAVGDALVRPFLADVVGQGLGVLGDIWGLAVGADAGVGEGRRVAGVGLGVGGVGRGGLGADSEKERGLDGGIFFGVGAGRLGGDIGRGVQGTLGLLVGTPGLLGAVVDAVGVDGVVLLGGEGGEEGGGGEEDCCGCLHSRRVDEMEGLGRGR